MKDWKSYSISVVNVIEEIDGINRIRHLAGKNCESLEMNCKSLEMNCKSLEIKYY